MTDLKLCFKCPVATDHQNKKCPKGVVCAECGRNHATVMHLGTPQAHGGEPPKFSKNESIASKCTEVCGDVFGGKFCAKIELVNVSYQNQIKHTQERLQEGGKIRLHKIMSNCPAVLGSFPTIDLAKDITEIDFSTESHCVQKSLGLRWDIVRDIFTYQVSEEVKPYTKRGLFSTISTITSTSKAV